MTKQPLHNIDVLFQRKLEELPVDISQQQEQWLSLNKSLHKQPKSFLSQLSKSWAKWFYFTIIALTPFGIFYYSTQQVAENKAIEYKSHSVTKSLPSLNRSYPIQSRSINTHKQAAIEIPEKVINNSATLTISQNASIGLPEKNHQLEKSKDSVYTSPVKQEKPVTKKADSAYIYWQ